MWCSRCQQDVPAAFAPGAKGKATCARCGRGVNLQVRSPSDEAASPESLAASSTGAKSPLDLADWKLEDDLREAQRLVRLIQLQCDEPATAAFDDEEPPLASDAAGEPIASAPRAAHASHSGGRSLLPWLLLGCGLSGLVCGCALLVWSHVTGRNELWNIGLPVALVSQAVLACGLVLQHDFRGQPTAGAASEVPSHPPAATHLHVNTGGAMQASGLSVHFTTTPQQQAAPTSRQIKQQVEAAMKRRAA